MALNFFMLTPIFSESLCLHHVLPTNQGGVHRLAANICGQLCHKGNEHVVAFGKQIESVIPG
jgi:hypothetical protein